MNSSFMLHLETEALLRCLKAVPLGGDITYHALSAACGRDVTGPARGRLQSARRIAQRDGVAFTVVRGSGLRRIRLDEAPGIGVVARARIRSQAGRASAAIRAVVAVSNGAPPEVSRRISSELSALGLLAEVAGEPAQKAFVSDKPPMPPATAGAAFLRQIGALTANPELE